MLDKESSWYVIIVMPMGKWCRKCIPIGFRGSTNWASATIEKIYKDVLDKVKLYIDNIRLFHTNWEKHLAMIDQC
jgi:hypothetical protein